MIQGSGFPSFSKSVHLSVNFYDHQASTLLFRSVLLKPFKIIWQHSAQKTMCTEEEHIEFTLSMCVCVCVCVCVCFRFLFQNRVRPITSSCMVAFKKYFAQMIIKTRQDNVSSVRTMTLGQMSRSQPKL